MEEYPFPIDPVPVLTHEKFGRGFGLTGPLALTLPLPLALPVPLAVKELAEEGAKEVNEFGEVAWAAVLVLGGEEK